MAPHSHVEPGVIIAERYRIEELLGRGGMGVVYRATQLELNRPVALKLLSAELNERSDARARFKREARVAAALRHRGAVEIYDFDSDGDTLFIAMELLPGATLRQTLKAAQGPLQPLERAVSIASAVVDVLIAAAALDVVHRDLKPSNIFLVSSEDDSERVVVADFGLAFIANHRDVGRLTREGLMSGTPAYVSPEQALGRRLSTASDIYSLGCTLFEMLTGRPPFVGENEVDVVTKHLFSLPKKASQACPEASIPVALDELLDRMLAKRPEERPTPQELRKTLTTAGGSARSSERSRGEEHQQPRLQRMVAQSEPSGQDETLLPDEPLSLPDETSVLTPIAVIGDPDELSERAMAANGFLCLPADQGIIPENSAAIFAPRAPLERLVQLLQRQLPLLTDVDPEDMTRLARLVELGVDEVLPRPFSSQELARRLRRALRRRKRRGRAS